MFSLYLNIWIFYASFLTGISVLSGFIPIFCSYNYEDCCYFGLPHLADLNLQVLILENLTYTFFSCISDDNVRPIGGVFSIRDYEHIPH